MARSTAHPSDESLLRAADGELPSALQAAVEIHLAACASCSARQQAMVAAAGTVAAAGRVEGSAPPLSDAFRARVRTNVARLSQEMDASWSRAGGTSAVAFSKWVAAGAVGAAVVALVAAMTLTRPHLDGVPAPEEDLVAVPPGALPVPSLTPGATRPVGLAEICDGGQAVERPISTAVRQAVLRDYRMEGVPAHEYELDYLITPELGGSDDRQNLWPERYEARVWNARVKDELERLLPSLVCRGEVDLATAQRDIAVNWIAAYKKYFRTDRPLKPRADVMRDDAVVPALVSLAARAGSNPSRPQW